MSAIFGGVYHEYRYRLWRHIRALDVDAARCMAVIMLNPSTANEYRDDPTIRRCLELARADGCGRLDVVNLYGFRSSHPDDLRGLPDPVGPENDEHVRSAIDGASRIVVAWGSPPEPTRRKLPIEPTPAHRIGAVLAMVGDRDVWCYGVNEDGQPRHPAARGRMRIDAVDACRRWVRS